ncbi:MAG: hypothetical protein PVI30_25645 [Myxococcales bacterium]|jgi:hypothetical protein
MPDRVIFTALPRRIAPGSTAGTFEFQLSVFVSPRLDPGPTLDAVATRFGGFDNMTTWLQQLLFAVEFEGVQTQPGAVASTMVPGDWDLLFPPATPVESFGYTSLSAKRILSFPVGRVQSTLLGMYKGLALEPDQLPKLRPASDGTGSDLSPLFGALADMNGALREIETSVGPDASDGEIAQFFGVAAADTDMAAAVAGLYRAIRFYRRRIGNEDPKDVQPPPEVQPLEFHQMLALLADHPLIMRRLGIVIDLTLELRAVTALEPGGRVRVNVSEAAGPVQGIAVSSPWTRFVADSASGLFQPEPGAGSDLADGMLDLSNPSRFELIQLDVDGSAFKTVQHAVSLRNQETQEQPPELPSSEPVAALRTQGIGVAETARAEGLKIRFVEQDTINAAIESDQLGGDDVGADELLRGYRVDVLDQGVWRSLNARDGDYVVGSGGGAVMLKHSDEGYVKAASVSSNEEDADDLYAHEMVFSWDGWSMSARRPGRDLSVQPDEDDPMVERATIENVPNDPHPDLDLTSNYEATPGTLPRLRFGRTYQMRARAVDIAGNSLDLDEASAAYASQETTYRRFEPVNQPTLVYRRPVTEGEWIEHLVIRSDYDASAASWTDRDLVADLGYATTSERHVAPPKATQAMCETHGMFDALMTSEDQGSHQESYLLSLRESGTFLDRELLDPASAQYVALQPQPELHHTPTTPVRFHDAWPENRGDPLGPGQYVVHPGDSAALPYLPDPMARGIVLWTPGPEGILEQKDYAGSWWEQEPFRLVLREGSEVDSDIAFDTDGETLDIRLPKAFIVRLRYGSTLDPDRLGEMQFWEQTSGEPAAAEAVRQGTHWMFSPHRELTLVHAVQRPLEPPQADVSVDGDRELQQTYTTVSDTLACHNHSSGQVDLYAHWDDWRDDLSHPAPRLVRRTAHIATVYPDYDGDGVLVNGAVHEFGDTQHHDVVYQAIATTRFREYFPPSLWKDKRNIERPELVFGEADEDDPGAPLPLDKAPTVVLNTARPAKPQVRYVVPTMRFEEGSDGDRLTRTGRGVRVYLERPWYSSGNGELLGVVLPSTGPGAVPEDLVTAWASDPLRLNRAPTNPLQAAHFVNSVDGAEALSLPGTELEVDVVGFEVEWDEEAGSWFCDIEIDSGAAYFPFLRFSFCRFQPDSIDGAHLSAAVPTDFIQVLPDRVATIRRNDDDFTVTLSGFTQDNDEGPQDVDTPEQPNLNQLQLPGNQGPIMGLSMDLLSPAPELAAHHLVLARVEARTGDGELSWTPANVGVELTPYAKNGEPGVVVWRGDVGPALESSETLRVVVEEYELYPVDADVAPDDPSTAKMPPEPQRQGGYGTEGTVAGSRLVFVAHFIAP